MSARYRILCEGASAESGVQDCGCAKPEVRDAERIIYYYMLSFILIRYF
jgi:hypothetical protein